MFSFFKIYSSRPTWSHYCPAYVFLKDHRACSSKSFICPAILTLSFAFYVSEILLVASLNNSGQLHQGIMEALLHQKLWSRMSALTQREPCLLSIAEGFESRHGLVVQLAAYDVSPGPALRRQRV